MALEHLRPTLIQNVSKLIWNLRSSFQSKFKCSPFEIRFSRKPNTIWNQLASNSLSDGILDKRKSILSKGRALEWESDDQVEEGFMDTMIQKKQSLLEKVYESDYPSKPSSFLLPLQNPFKKNFGKLREA